MGIGCDQIFLGYMRYWSVFNMDLFTLETCYKFTFWKGARGGFRIKLKYLHRNLKFILNFKLVGK